MTRNAAIVLLVVPAVAGFAVLGAGPLAGQPPGPAKLIEVPVAPLDAMEDVVRELFEERRAAVRDLAGEPAKPAELAAAYGALGALYLSYGMSAPAEACFSNAHTLDGGDYRWSYYLATLLQNERPDRAAGLLERTLKLRPAYPPALIRLAETYLARNQPEAALARFEAALPSGEPYAAAALYGQGRAAALQGDFSAAVRYFEGALGHRSEAGAVHHSLGLAYRELGDLDKARGHLRKAGQDQPVFPDPLLQGLTAQGATAHMLRGLGAFEEGHYEAAEEHSRKAVDADPDNPVMHKQLAESLLALGETGEAIAHFREALRLDPGSPRAHVALAAALAETEDGAAEALELARTAIRMAPDYAEAHFFLGYRQEDQGDYPAALGSYERALEIAPDDLRARRGRARTLGLLGRSGPARQELEELIALDPNDFESVLDLATLLARSGDPGAAVSRLEAALAGDLDAAARALGHFNLANLSQQRGDLDAAESHYREAVLHDPDFKDAHFNLATLLGKMGRSREAATSFAQVLEMDPDDLQAYLGRARALIDAGRFALARSELEKGLELEPEDVSLAHALARLLAGCPSDGVRDGERALELASRALKAQASVGLAETVAMALAELGRFEDAVRWQQQILAQARQGGADGDTVDRLEVNLALYREGKPYRGL